MWEYLSPRQHSCKLYVELATVLGRYMARYTTLGCPIDPIIDPIRFPIRWANTSTQHFLQTYIAMTEEIIQVLRKDNPPFNEARFRREMDEVSRKYQQIAPHLDDQ